jgi:alpha,alpha-trehalase
MKKIISFAFLSLAFFMGQAQMPANVAALRNHIDSILPRTVRTNTADEQSFLGLPKPYSVPCIRGAFQEMYYWDTYYTNVGLIIAGDAAQAKNNIDDIMYLINKYGYMPNGSNVGLLNRSQPPYASLMVRELYSVTHDKKWLAGVVKTLEKEYKFWMTKRIAPNGLNRYGHCATDDELVEFYNDIASRLRIDPANMKTTREEKIHAGANWLAEAESGWDFDPRYDQRCLEFNPVDLNANLYIYELNFEYFYRQLGWKNAIKWRKLANRRKALINRYCYNAKDGLFYDYDFVNRHLSPVLSGGVFNLMFARVMSKTQASAMRKALGHLEMEHGVAACEKGKREITYQWDFPNAWASVNYMAMRGLDNYGYKNDARRLAQKYLDSNVRQYGQTGVLWEKYNALTGNNDAAAEYETPGQFMGWTAGVVLFTIKYLY